MKGNFILAVTLCSIVLYKGDFSGSGTYLVASTTALSVDCSCIDSAPTAVAPIPTLQPTPLERPSSPVPGPTSSAVAPPTTFTPFGTVEDPPAFAVASCGESDEFWITASQASEIEGCYKKAEASSGSGGVEYTPTGTLMAEQVSVAATLTNGESVSMFYLKHFFVV